MNRSKCPVCGSRHTLKNGKRNGVQTFKCGDCGYQFRNSSMPTNDSLWRLYQENKQTVAELSVLLGVSESTIKRRLGEVNLVWEQPPLEGSGFVHLDATYFGRSWGVMAAVEEERGIPLYMSFIKHETNADYVAAVKSIEDRGYKIEGLILDGKRSLFSVFSEYKIQMCQFHMIQIVSRYLTDSPRLMASRDLLDLMSTLTSSKEAGFRQRFEEWKRQYRVVINKRTLLKSGASKYRHDTLRKAMTSIEFYMPYLFTYQQPGCEGMPNTNNKIEGTFTDLKRNANVHNGMSTESRKRLICGFFLALWKNTAR